MRGWISISSVMLSAACLYPPLEITDGSANTGSGDSISSSGAGANGSTTSGAGGAGAGLFGNALDWKGACSFVQPTESAHLEFSSPPFTIELWFKVEPLNIYGELVGKGLPEVPGWGLEIIEPYTRDPHLRFCWSTDGIGSPCSGRSIDLHQGSAYHLAVVVDENMTIAYYTLSSGEAMHIRGTDGLLDATWDNAAQEFWIGGYCDNSNALGAMDELRLWNVARTQQELDDNAFTALGVCESPGLVAYYDFENDTGAAIADVCGTAHATIPANYTEPDHYTWIPSPF